MMKTYAEILAEKEKEKMSNYDMDELRRQGKVPEDIIEQKESEAAVTVELPDDVILKLALQAHERDITLNKMCKIVLTSSLKDLEYRYEHQSKPQVLKEY